MVVQEIRKSVSPGMREVIAFPDIRTFYELLQDRLHMLLSRYSFLNDPFTVFVNALPRERTQKINRFENVVLNYAGVNQQRLFLEGGGPQQIPSLDTYWDTLDKATLISEKAVVSSDLYQQFRDGKHSLNTLIASSGTLTDYFKLTLPEEERESNYNIWQICEYHILNYHFDLAKYRYLSVPLIQFGEFDGVIHIVYSERDHQAMLDPSQPESGLLAKEVVGNIIKAFSGAYEGIILDWELVGTNADKDSAIRAALDAAVDPVFFETFNNNPILKELGFQDFYKRFKSYYKKRVEQSEVIPRERRRQHHKIAIMSILIDSYAHNVTAHSLTALEWWFRLRAEREKRSGGNSYEQFVEDYAANPVVAKDSLAIELYPLMKFLLDKGAFWTGLTRERSFGGKISSLFSVLWYDFINNPLYLGTIAFSEGILKLNINITILEEVENEEKAFFHKRIKKTDEGTLLDGTLVSIDLSKLKPSSQGIRPGKISEFIIPGEYFNEFSSALKEYKAFFPGGVVGRHAFFTILENEIRNVKHYDEASIEQMQKNGLTLNISIEEDTYRKAGYTTGQKDYYKIGVWIKQPIMLDQKLVALRINRLGEDIINEESFRPKLGGTYQDKVCASMLFNNTFTSVQNKEGQRNKRFYPWMKVGGAFIADQSLGEVHDYELSWRRYSSPEYANSRGYFNKNFGRGHGYFKKFFHIWKGEHIYNVGVSDAFSSIYENYSRFRFVSLPPADWNLFCRIRKEGVFRILHEPVQSLHLAYRVWMKTWLKSDKCYRVVFKVNRQPAAHIWWDKAKVVYQNRAALRKLDKHTRALLLDTNHTEVQEINLVHGNGDQELSSSFCRFRSHGILKRHFLAGQHLHQASLQEADAAELLEILATRVAVFDNRIANRIEKRVNREQLAHTLNCFIFKEDLREWKQQQIYGFQRYHFLVVHLSFIEAFRDTNGHKLYSENNIAGFIRKEILGNGFVADNFILVITTGRGRTQWWSSLEKGTKDNYSYFTTFRPVESLIDSVENAINMEDDFELKYRLVKVLFGS